jgi:hypothetical protein
MPPTTARSRRLRPARPRVATRPLQGRGSQLGDALTAGDLLLLDVDNYVAGADARIRRHSIRGLLRHYDTGLIAPRTGTGLGQITPCSTWNAPSDVQAERWLSALGAF